METKSCKVIKYMVPQITMFQQIVYIRIMKAHQYLILLMFCVFINHSSGFSQTKKETIYYLADTSGVRPGNRILVIGEELKNTYAFYCKCIPSINTYLVFTFKEKPKFLYDLPKHKYLEWNELQSIAYDSGTKFNEQYIFYIVEKLPKGYQEALVEHKIFKLAGTTQ